MEKMFNTLTLLAIILIVLWIAGLLTAINISGAIHILLVFAIIILLMKLFNRQRAF